ncbi:hypothetical protein [Myroides sp. N17-2]|uniref:hypothetical protein n=1 Tax=Myroides sp. N17-2 TaxID=2030799 RepID=UPI000EFA7353|nr:hypothetical protein [Myroides sp. N17-2]
MIYLDKTNTSAIKYVEDFINNNWLPYNDNDDCKYINIDFRDIKNPVSTFKAFFVEEQENICCYCSRKILNDNNTELEHIIPYALSDILEFQLYYDLSPILENNVMPQDTFINTLTKRILPKYPHRIAYHNIVASCNGQTFKGSEGFTCCNRERGNEFIPPFNLIHNSISYLKDGTIVYLEDLENQNGINILNLNKPLLQHIRRLWYLFSLSDLTINEIFQYELPLDEHIVINAINHSPQIEKDTNLLKVFTNGLWDIFTQYSFFFNYYRINYPSN